MLDASRGCFSLSFAVCNDRGLRDQLIRQLTDAYPGIALVALQPHTPDVLQAVEARLGASTPAALFVLDLEASVPFQAAAYPTLRALNAAREAWQRLACPVVFWLADYAAARVAAWAPDLWRYRSHQFDFASEQATPDRALGESFPGFDMVDGLPFEERRFRMVELEQRVREVGDPPAPELLAHALGWLYELAHLYRHANRFAEAEDLFRRGLGWAERTYGPDDPRTAAALNNLAQLLKATNRLAEAEPLVRRALAMAERGHWPDRPTVATALSNLAQLLKATNRQAEAEALIRRALVIDEQSHGPDHPTVARDLLNLAGLLHATNRVSEAEPLMRRALAIDERSLGPDHPAVAAALNNLAGLLHATNRLAEAEPLMRRALAIAERGFGPDHPAVAVALNNLAQLLKASNRLAEAEILMRRALVILLDSSRRAGHPHPDLETAIHNYRAQLAAQGKDQAEIAAALAGLGLDGTLGA
jgi:tetratricopeptide (TPR) repeat protein